MQEEWQEWATQGGTQAFADKIQQLINDKQDHVGKGGCLNPESVDNTALKYASAQGRINGLIEVKELISDLAREKK